MRWTARTVVEPPARPCSTAFGRRGRDAPPGAVYMARGFPPAAAVIRPRSCVSDSRLGSPTEHRVTCGSSMSLAPGSGQRG
jgi:hypothetical protein